jgi:predicted RNA binding protein YcfA (HicA-like mRNA interferase family)
MGYEETRQTGGHVRLTTQQFGVHHVTVPLHDALRIGTLANILSDVETHFGLTREELLRRLSL